MRMVSLLLLLPWVTATAAAASTGRPVGTYVKLAGPPLSLGPRAAGGEPTVIYMNRHGGTYYPANVDDSSQNQSTIVDGTSQLQPFSYGDASWNQVMQCMREMYARFNVDVTDEDPGAKPHVESVVAGYPSDIGMPDYVGGVAPFYCEVIDNAIVYSFSEIYGNDPRSICETAAQETAHAFGLDHELLCEDPMTYLYGCGDKTFQDTDAPCGEDRERECSCGGYKQNSVQILLAALGPRNEVPPTVRITGPHDGANVIAGFLIDVAAADDVGIAKIELDIDGLVVGEDDSFPYSFTAPDRLGEGEHELTVRALDVGGMTARASIRVVLRAPCSSSTDCANDEVCAGSRCVAGPDVDGGLGQSCAAGADCASGSCGDDGVGHRLCVEACDPAKAFSCPLGFDCLAADQAGVCWPGGSSSGGCATARAAGGAWAWLLGTAMLGAALTLGARRRRKRA